MSRRKHNPNESPEQRRDRIRENQKRYYLKNKEMIDARRREHYWANHEQETTKRKNRAPIVNAQRRAASSKTKQRRRDLWRQKKYGITPEQWDDLFAKQNGCCAICGVRPTKRLHVDHNHHTGAVRGLLCNNCNLGLGKFGDNPNLTELATQYLIGTASCEPHSPTPRSCCEREGTHDEVSEASTP